MLKDCPHWKHKPEGLHILEETVIVEDMERETPQIYAALDIHQADHQSIVVEVAGKIAKQYISILIDLGYTHSYITPYIVDIFASKKYKHSKSWLVQLSMGTKKKVNETVDKFPLEIGGLSTCANINIFPLGSYDILIGMDWLEAHKVNIDCYNKTFECMDEEGNPSVVRGIPKGIFVRQVSSMHLKKFCRKGC